MPGHTMFALGLAGTLDGMRVAYTGDNLLAGSLSPLRAAAPIYRNVCASTRSGVGVERLIAHEPELLLTGHTGALEVTPGRPRRIRRAGPGALELVVAPPRAGPGSGGRGARPVRGAVRPVPGVASSPGGAVETRGDRRATTPRPPARRAVRPRVPGGWRVDPARGRGAVPAAWRDGHRAVPTHGSARRAPGPPRPDRRGRPRRRAAAASSPKCSLEVARPMTRQRPASSPAAPSSTRPVASMTGATSGSPTGGSRAVGPDLIPTPARSRRHRRDGPASSCPASSTSTSTSIPVSPTSPSRPIRPAWAAARRPSSMAGSSGANTFPGSARWVIEPARGRILALPEHQRDRPDRHRSSASCTTCASPTRSGRPPSPWPTRDLIVGFKVRLSEMLAGPERARGAGPGARGGPGHGLPVMVHIGGTPFDIEEVARPASSRRHRDPRVTPAGSPARSSATTGGSCRAPGRRATRGVRFDVGHGAGSFTWPRRRGRPRRRLPTGHDQHGPPSLQHRVAGPRPRDDDVEVPAARPVARRGRRDGHDRAGRDARRGRPDARQPGRRGGGGRHGPAPRGGPVRPRRLGGRRPRGPAAPRPGRRGPGRRADPDPGRS